MLAVDTSVLVRLLTNDHPHQAARAKALFESQSIFIAKTVLLELEWVLRNAYGHGRPELAQTLLGLAGLPQVTVEDAAATRRALAWFAQGMDFADALHLSAAGACEGFVSFDVRLGQAAERLASTPVIEPPGAQA
jgi:predicted nucleic-acid-binding protein